MKKVIFIPQPDFVVNVKDLKINKGQILVYVLGRAAHLYVYEFATEAHFLTQINHIGNISAHSKSLDEMLNKFIDDPGEFYLFDSLKEFCEVAIERGWK